MSGGGTATHRLIVFTRYPEPGRVKTRLIPLLGADGAAELHRRMTRHTLAAAAGLRSQLGADVVVRFTGGKRLDMERLYGGQWALEEQGDGELGSRLERAVGDAFAAGRTKVVVVGCDCPELTPRLLQDAFAALHPSDVVIGPALDGGYYLIGLSRLSPGIFGGIPWGTERVLDETLRAARRLSLTVQLLPALRDVDRPDDLGVWERVAATA